MIAHARARKRIENLENLTFIESDFETMDFRNEFDCAVFYDSLHHSDDELQALQKVYQALKPGGLCLTVEPGKGHHKTESAKTAMLKWDVNEKSMPPPRIVKLAKQCGFMSWETYHRPRRLHEVLWGNPSGSPLMNELLKWKFMKTLGAILFLLMWRRWEGIVVLRK